MEVEKLKYENKLLMDKNDSFTGDSLHSQAQKDDNASSNSNGSDKVPDETEDTCRRGSSLLEYIDEGSSSSADGGDMFEETFEKSFYSVESTKTTEIPTAVPSLLTTFNPNIRWRVTCRITLNQLSAEKPLWKVQMKWFPAEPRTTTDGQSKFMCNGNQAPMLAKASTEQNSVTLRDPRCIYKIIFLGDNGVGKTSYIRRFCEGTFRSNFESTIGIDLQEKELTLGNRRVILQLWDTAGQERFQSLCKQYFRKVDAVLVMYDVTSEKSFVSVRKWMESMQDNAGNDIVKLLVGNKIDEERCVQQAHGLQLAKTYGAMFFETSVKYGVSVNEAMLELAKCLQQRYAYPKGFHLKLKEQCQTKKRCC